MQNSKVGDRQSAQPCVGVYTYLSCRTEVLVRSFLMRPEIKPRKGISIVHMDLLRRAKDGEESTAVFKAIADVTEGTCSDTFL